MSGETRPPSTLQRRLPNALTVGRLVLTLAFVAVLSFYRYPEMHAWALPTALALFVVAALTDALDGHLARKWNVISLFGRVADPAADKVLVMGALVLLASPIFYDDGLGRAVSGLEPWMVVAILAREFLVTSMRAVLESTGVSFGAIGIGKLKMVLQSVAVPLALLLVWLAAPADLTAGGWARWTLDLLFWGVTLVTLASGVPYLRALFVKTEVAP